MTYLNLFNINFKGRLAVLSLTFLLFCHSSYAQFSFQKTIGGTGIERSNSIIPAQGGGFIITGSTTSIGSGGQDLYIVKLDAIGDIEWSKTFGGTGNDVAEEVQATPDGGYIFVGRTTSYSSAGEINIFAVKTDFMGGLQWSKSYGGTQADYGTSIKPTSDNGYLIGGFSLSYGTSGFGKYLLKTDSAGLVLWGKAYDNTNAGAPASDYIQKVLEDPYGNYIAAGYAKRSGSCNGSNSNWYMSIIKTDNTGNLIWNSFIGGNNCSDRAHDMIQVSDGNYILSGTTQNFGAGSYDVYLAKVDSGNGSIIWTNTYGGTGDEIGYSVYETADSGLVVAGYTNSFGAGGEDVYLLKTDDSGNLEWSRTYGESGDERALSVLQDNDKGFMLAGHSNSFGSPANAIYIIKTDSMGNINCNTDTAITLPGAGGIINNGFSTNSGSFEITAMPDEDTTASSVNMLCCPIVNFTADTVCYGDTTSFTDLSFGEIDNWEWDFGDGSSSVLQYPSHNYSSSGNYIVSLIISNISGCVDTLILPVTVNPTPIISYTPAAPAICSGDSISVTANSSGGTGPFGYIWSNNQTTATATGLTAGTYTVVATDNNGCKDTADVTVTEFNVPVVSVNPVAPAICPGDSVSVTASCSGGAGPFGYTWSDNQTTATAIGLTAGTYTVIATDNNGCKDTADITITEFPAVLVNILSDNVSCFGGNDGQATANASGGSGSYSYYWSGGQNTATATALSAGTYTVTVEDANFCNQTKTVNIIEPDSLILLVSDAISICKNDSTTINATAQGGTTPYKYDWNPGTMNDSSVQVSPAVTTTYTVILTDNNNCVSDSQFVTVTVNDLPELSFTADPKSGCAPLCVNFKNTTPNTGTANWSFGDGLSTGGLDSSYCFSSPGAYSITLAITDNNGCMAALSVPDLIQVHAKPVADFSIVPSRLAYVNSPVLFFDQSIDADYWLWNFGNKDSSTLKDPTFSYGESGSHLIILTTTNNEGCKDTTSKTIQIESDLTIYIPDAFSPDSDGLNDSFAPKGTGIESFEMEIYNRWGENIYFTKDEDKPWNGKTRDGNSIVQEDVYIYVIKVKDIKHQNHYYVGQVNLIR